MAIAAVVVLVLLGGGIFLASKNNTAVAPAPSDNTTQTTPPAAVVSMAPEASSANSITPGAVKEFTVTGSSFKFVPATLSVNKGDTVKITFKNSDGQHNIMFDDFSAGSKTIQSGATDTFQFVASKSGSFQYYCSVGNHKAMGMVGTLTVK